MDAPNAVACGLLLLLCRVMLCATATLISSSQLDMCTNTGDVDGLSCSRKFVMSIAVDGGSGGGEAVGYEWATARDAHSGASVTLTDTVTIVVTKSVPTIRYPVYYVRNFNAKAYEAVAFTGLFGCAAQSSSTSPTCGRAYSTTTGAPIVYSEGYCCSCSFCDLISLCDSDSRATTECSIFGDAQSASCLRFDGRWYSGYNIGPGQRQFSITVNISSRTHGSVLLTVGPDVLGASDRTRGVAVRLVGDFASFAEPWDLTHRMLLVPAGGPGDSRVASGEAEWLIVPLSSVTVDGTECNKIGVSYEGFFAQANRCAMRAGSCTRNQIDDLRAADIAALAAGKAASYFLSAYGTFVYGSANQSGAMPYVSYRIPSISPSLITLTFAADNVSYVINVANGSIVFANITNHVVASASRDGVLSVMIRNTGTVAAEYSISVLACSSGVFPITAQVASIEQGGNYSTKFQVQVMVAATATTFCDVLLLNSQQVVLDRTRVEWITTATEESNGAQGGEAPTNGDVTLSAAWGSVTCPECPWFNPLCFLTQQCFWGFVFQLAVVVLLLTALIWLLRCQRCLTRAGCHESQDSSDDDASSRRRRRASRQREPYATEDAKSHKRNRFDHG